MDLRSFSPRHPLLWMMCRTSSELCRLRNVLRVRRGNLRWTGQWTALVVPDGMRDEEARLLVGALLCQRGASRRVLLPSEERLSNELEQKVCAWLKAVSSWQIVVAGDVSWTADEALVWRRELDVWVGRWLYRFWRTGVFFKAIPGWIGYRLRHAQFMARGILVRH